MPRLTLRGIFLLMTVILCCAPAFAEFRPGISVVEFTAMQFADDVLPPAAAPATATAAAQPAPQPEGPPPLRSLAEQNKERAKKLQITLKPADLARLTLAFKSALLNSTQYRLIPGARKMPGQVNDLAQVQSDVTQGKYEGSNYVITAQVIYSDTPFMTAPVPGTRDLAHTLAFGVVAEFTLINTLTGKSESFSVIGTGKDAYNANISSSSINVNRVKILKEAAESLAAQALRELNNRIDPQQAARADLEQATTSSLRIQTMTLQAPPDAQPSKKPAAKPATRQAPAKPATPSASPAIQ